MGIERLEHAADGAVDQPVGRRFTDVVVLDRAERRGEHLVLVGKLILGDEGVAAEEATDERTADDHEHGGRKRAVPAHTQNLHPCLDPVQIAFL